jgi:hypothetical protein
MKTKNANIVTTFILALLMVPISIFAQSTDYTIDEEYEWQGESQKATLYITVKSNSSEMMVNLNGTVMSGKLEVNLFDPDGEKIPGFVLVADGSGGDGNNSISVTNNNGKNTVSTSSSSSSSSSNSTSISDDKWGSSTFTTTTTAESGSKGVLSKVLTDPEPGKWKIVISTRDMTGELDVQVDQD